jgi:hypothetical protein
MSEPMAFQGVLTGVRHLKTRDMVQFVVEVEGAENANKALNAIGGFPKPGESRWVAVACIATSANASAENALPQGVASADTSAKREADPFEIPESMRRT